jgi:flagellar basal-body rod protein FlgG
MERGLYIAASGMLAELARQDQIANDLANASTPGYKADRSAQQSFGDMLLVNGATGAQVGPLNLGAQIAGTRADLSQGALRDTGEPLDVALEGEGFLAVQTPAGTRYTRNGQLMLDGAGRLTTGTGDPVLDDAGEPIALGTTDEVAIAPDGAITLKGKQVARLGIASLTNPVKEGDSLFSGTAGGRPAGTTVRAGSLEASSVDAARAMVEMITSLRDFEAQQRVVHAIDETLEKGLSVGSMGGG